MKVTFLRAADAFLYLPLHLAEHFEIFQSLDKNLTVESITPFESHASGKFKKGDIVAMNELLRQSEKSEGLPLAICDPMALFEPDLKKSASDFVILGALLNKVPFWAVNGVSERAYNSEVDLKDNFDEIVHYNSGLATGYYIGRRTKELAAISQGHQVEFGGEFAVVMGAIGNKRSCLAVTADLISVALHTEQDSTQPLAIHLRYANNINYRQFVTTAIITTREAFNYHKKHVVTVLQAIQSASAVLMSSKKAAYSVCETLSRSSDYYNEYHFEQGIVRSSPALTPSQLKMVVDLMYEDDFFNESLSFREEQWSATLDSRIDSSVTEQLKDVYREGKEKYAAIVENQAVINAQRGFVERQSIQVNVIAAQEIADAKNVAQNSAVRFSGIFGAMLMLAFTVTIIALKIQFSFTLPGGVENYFIVIGPLIFVFCLLSLFFRKWGISWVSDQSAMARYWILRVLYWSLYFVPVAIFIIFLLMDNGLTLASVVASLGVAGVMHGFIQFLYSDLTNRLGDDGRKRQLK